MLKINVKKTKVLWCQSIYQQFH